MTRTIAAAAMIAAVSAACGVARSEPVELQSSGAPQTQPSVQPQGTPTNAANKSERAGKRASAETPESFVSELYRVHGEDQRREGPHDRILGGKDRSYLDKFFEKNLADLIWTDITTHTNEIGVLDFDIFYNSQDPLISNLVVHPATVRGDDATLRVSFTNDGAKETIVYMLVRRDRNWKIRDIKYRNGETLLQYFAEGPQ